MSYYGGIDPGLDGWVATVDDEGNAELSPIPTLGGSGVRRSYDLPGVLELVGHISCCRLILLEKQQPMPKQGVSSTFSIGFGYGMWRTALLAEGVPHEEIRPASWKSAMGVTVSGGRDANARRKLAKARAIEKAQALFPGVSLLPTARSRKPSADMAEALLLAHYARQRARGGA